MLVALVPLLLVFVKWYNAGQPFATDWSDLCIAVLVDVDPHHLHPQPPPALLAGPHLQLGEVLHQLRVRLFLGARVSAGVYDSQPAAVLQPAQVRVLRPAVQDRHQQPAVQPDPPAAVQHRLRRQVGVVRRALTSVLVFAATSSSASQ